VAAGFDPDAFWKQTPRSFVTIMQGAARAAKREHDEGTARAWLTANFSAAAQCGKLKCLSSYVKVERKRQSTDEMLAVLRSIAGSGTPLNIRKLN
jgi:hypothetical protein